MRSPIERWRAWRTVRGYKAAKQRLERITGQRFASLADAEKWVAENVTEPEQGETP